MFWSAWDVVFGHRLNGRYADALALLPELDGLAERTSLRDIASGYAAGERMYVYVRLGTPDRATADHRRMKECFARADAENTLGPALFAAEVLYDLPYRLSVDDYEGVVAAFEKARKDPRFKTVDASFRYKMERQCALAQIALWRSGRVRAEVAESALVSALENLEYRDLLLLRSLGAVQLASDRVDEASATLETAREYLASLRDRGFAGEVDELSFAVLQARTVLSSGVGSDALSAARSDLDAAWKFALDHVAADPAEGGVGILHFDLRQDALSEWVRLTESLGGTAEEALRPLVDAQERGALARSLGQADNPLSLVQRDYLTDKEHVLLVYLPASFRSHLFVVESTRVTHHELAPSYVLRQKRERLFPFLNRALDPQANARLADVVATASPSFFPTAVAERLETATSVTICAVGPLEAVPFELLCADGVTPLWRSHALDFVPSIPVAAALAADEQPAFDSKASERRYLVDLVVAPEPSDFAMERFPWVSELPIPEELWEDMVAAFPRDRVRIRSRGQATEQALSEAGESASLTLFAHGTQDELQLRPATLVLSPADRSADGLTTCSDVERMRAPRFVFLGACSTAAGPYRAGDESAQTLPGSFLRAGALAVVGAAREMEAAPTMRIATAMHRAFANGSSPAEALRQARIQLVDEGKYSSPIDHVHLRVLGLGQRPLFVPIERDGATSRWLVAAIALAVLCVIVSLLRLRRGGASEIR